MVDSINSTGATFVPPVPQSVAPGFAQAAATLPTASEIAAQSPTAAIFFSPAIKVDPQSHTVIYEQRDPKTGDVINQYPSKHVVDEYRRQALGQELQANVVIPNSIPGSIKIDAPPPAQTAATPVIAPATAPTAAAAVTATPAPPATVSESA